jgi:hypothetical protein
MSRPKFTTRRLPVAGLPLLATTLLLAACGQSQLADITVSDAVVRNGVGSQRIKTRNIASRPQQFREQILRDVGYEKTSAFSSSTVSVPASILTASGDCQRYGSTSISIPTLAPHLQAVCNVTYIATYQPPPDASQLTVTLGPGNNATNGYVSVYGVIIGANGKQKLTEYEVGGDTTGYFSELGG